MRAPCIGRPADFAQRAKLIVDIATGEIEDRQPTPKEQGKDPAAVSLGRRGVSKAEKLAPNPSHLRHGKI